jgi:hypothetical protein
MKKLPTVQPPLPGPYDPDEESPDPGWVHFLHAWEDGDRQPLINAMLDFERTMPGDDQCLRYFLAECLKKMKRKPGRQKKRPNRTFVKDFDGFAFTTVTDKKDSVTEKARAAAIWLKEYEKEHGAVTEDVWKEAVDKFKVHRTSIETHMKRSKKARGAFSI